MFFMSNEPRLVNHCDIFLSNQSYLSAIPPVDCVQTQVQNPTLEAVFDRRNCRVLSVIHLTSGEH